MPSVPAKKSRVNIRRTGVPLRLGNTVFSPYELMMLGKVWTKPFRKLESKDRLPQEWLDKTVEHVEGFVKTLQKKRQLSRAAAIDLLNEHALHRPFLQVKRFLDVPNKRTYWILFDPANKKFFWASERRKFKK